MGFSHEFTCLVRKMFAEDQEILRVLAEGDRPKMGLLLLRRMRLSPQEILERLETDQKDELRQDCETAKPITMLLEHLLSYEMVHGFSVIKKEPVADFDPHRVPL